MADGFNPAKILHLFCVANSCWLLAMTCITFLPSFWSFNRVMAKNTLNGRVISSDTRERVTRVHLKSTFTFNKINLSMLSKSLLISEL